MIGSSQEGTDRMDKSKSIMNRRPLVGMHGYPSTQTAVKLILDMVIVCRRWDE